MNSLVVWRLCAAKYAETAFSGEGAKRYGGRWSPPGLALVYASESRALAMLEVLANAAAPELLHDMAWVLIAAELAPDTVERPARYPESWRQFPHSGETQKFGAEWSRAGRSVALRVPSAVVAGEFNYLLNPAHPGFNAVQISRPEHFSFDPRLIE